MDKYNEIFDKYMEDKTLGEPIQRLNIAMREMNLAMIKDFPMWMKFNSISNLISMHNDIDINWDMVNNILNENIKEYDYNIFGRIGSLEELASERCNCIATSMNLGPYRKIICKKCKDEFTLDFGEVNFYEKKGFPLPKKCYCCKNNIKKPEAINYIKKTEEPEILKTDMQIALEKAGIK